MRGKTGGGDEIVWEGWGEVRLGKGMRGRLGEGIRRIGEEKDDWDA